MTLSLLILLPLLLSTGSVGVCMRMCICVHFRFIMSVFALMHVYAAHVCLVTKETRRQQQVPWNWSYGWV